MERHASGSKLLGRIRLLFLVPRIWTGEIVSATRRLDRRPGFSTTNTSPRRRARARWSMGRVISSPSLPLTTSWSCRGAWPHNLKLFNKHQAWTGRLERANMEISSFFIFSSETFSPSYPWKGIHSRRVRLRSNITCFYRDRPEITNLRCLLHR